MRILFNQMHLSMNVLFSTTSNEIKMKKSVLIILLATEIFFCQLRIKKNYTVLFISFECLTNEDNIDHRQLGASNHKVKCSEICNYYVIWYDNTLPQKGIML